MSGLSELLSRGAVPLQPKDNPAGVKSAETAKEFEAVFLSQFVDQMMKATSAAAFGGEKQAEMWRSFMSEAIAKQLVEQGGLGLSGSVENMLNAYAEGTQTDEGKKP